MVELEALQKARVVGSRIAVIRKYLQGHVLEGHADVARRKDLGAKRRGHQNESQFR